jgi:hypothetical protein
MSHTDPGGGANPAKRTSSRLRNVAEKKTPEDAAKQAAQQPKQRAMSKSTSSRAARTPKTSDQAPDSTPLPPAVMSRPISDNGAGSPTTNVERGRTQGVQPLQNQPPGRIDGGPPGTQGRCRLSDAEGGPINEPAAEPISGPEENVPQARGPANPPPRPSMPQTISELDVPLKHKPGRPTGTTKAFLQARKAVGEHSLERSSGNSDSSILPTRQTNRVPSSRTDPDDYFAEAAKASK